NRTQLDGSQPSQTVGIGGQDLGIVNGFNVPVVFDGDGARRIVDQNSFAPYSGYFRPEDTVTDLSAFNGLKPATGLNGQWTLTITDFRNGSVGTLKNW